MQAPGLPDLGKVQSSGLDRVQKLVGLRSRTDSLFFNSKLFNNTGVRVATHNSASTLVFTELN